MTVYVLEIETVDDGNYSYEVAVYKDLNKAKEVLLNSYETELKSFWKESYSENEYEYYYSALNAFIREKENADLNYTYWNIYSREVIE